MKKTSPLIEEEYLKDAARLFRAARLPVALTGAGISVASGIPDFRSKGGLWTRFAPNEYATREVFLHNPEKAWQLYRALGKTLEGKEPNPAHYALARLEEQGMLHGVVTQNVDMLHQRAGSKNVLEIHGDHQHLQCLSCGELEEIRNKHYTMQELPVCRQCGHILKPNVVLFGEQVRQLEEIYLLIEQCDLLLVVGTSAQVHPAAGLPSIIKQNNGLIFEFNIEKTKLTSGLSMDGVRSDFFFLGDAAETVPYFVDAVTS